MIHRIMRFLFFSCCLFLSIQTANAKPQWQELPPTPTLPKAKSSGFASLNGIRIWYATFGYGKPVILLHGGLANSNYWGNQVAALAKYYQVIVMDSRGHGQSTNNGAPFDYHLMATDVIALMDFLKIKQAAIVGWSDGADIGLDIAIHHPNRLTKLFAFAANSNADGVTADVAKNPVFVAYIARAKTEYEKLSSTPKQYKNFYDQISKMWSTQPNFTKEQLSAINVPTWIVDGDRDEAIKRTDTEFMAATIPNAGMLIEPWVSHFAFLQDPEQFNDDLLNFLKKNPSW